MTERSPHTLTIKRVWRDTQGSPLASNASIGASSVTVEEVVDFDEDGGDFVIGVDSGIYTGIDEDTNEVLGLSPVLTVAHPKGTFLQDGAKARGPKYADGYLDDATSVTESVFIPSHLRRLFPIGGREAVDMEVVPVALDDDGSLYIVDGPPDEELAVDPVVFAWSATGNVSVGTKVHRFPVPFGGTIEEVKMVMGTGGAPSGSSIIVDILKGGTSILTDKVIVPDGDLGSDPVEPTTKEVNKGNIIQIEFEQVGSTTPGSDPTLYVTMFPSENAIARRIEVAGPEGPAGTNGTNGANGADGADGLISEVRDEGVAVTDAGVMDFTGAGVTTTSDGSVITVNIPGGGGGGGGFSRLVGVRYAPGADTLIDIAGTTLTALDTTNLRATFTAPSSGAVLVVLQGLVNLPSATTYAAWWGLLDGASQVGDLVAVGRVSAANATPAFNGNVSIYVSGLTPSSSYSFDWAAVCSAAGGTVRHLIGPTRGQPKMDVFSA